MTTIAVFPSVLGVRRGVTDLADRLRAAGHEVHVLDLLEGATFDTYDPAMANWRAAGETGMQEQGLAMTAGLPDGFVVAGFSAGSGVATAVALQRPVSGLLQLSGANPPEWFGEGAAFPPGLRGQIHQMVDDPFHDGPEVLADAVRGYEAAGGSCEVFDYPGNGHLFTDPTLPEEYDADAAQLLHERVLAFVASAG